jgi:tripartite-type tricarboxylate transporter receptor subunit TctC
VVTANPALNVQNLRQFIALAKARPGQLNYASGGTGNATHLAVELFRTMAAIDVVHLPYQGAGPAIVALIAGEAQFAVANLTAALPHFSAGRLVPLAVTSEKRSSFLPQLPSAAEAGVAGYEVSAWFGVLAPRGVPRDVVAKLNALLVQAAQTPEIKKTLAVAGAEPAAGTPEQFAAFIRAEKTKWVQVINRAGIAVD